MYGTALAGGGGLRLLQHSGRVTALPVHVWTSDEAPGDRGLLARCRGPVLDVGCGPGRLAAALLGQGVPALGVDIAPGAVALARARGATALERSVYERLPGERRWATVLLADGNIGIGGNPVRLLSRIHDLLAPGGVLLVEARAPGSTTGSVRMQLQDDLGDSEHFAWAWLALDDVAPAALAAGLRPAGTWADSGRWFARLIRP